MIIEGIETTEINGKETWTVDQFAKLTGKKEGTIRSLLWKGNRRRTLRHIHAGNKPFILAEELFEFPFLPPGRMSQNRSILEKYILDEDGKLKKVEEIIEECR